jgi:NAD(P)-dependent dehydrogenase (short-subunit alcohol dehydrogenase family)
MTNPFGFEGRNAIVLGGASGIGAAVADLLRNMDANVTVLDVAESVVRGIRSIHIDLREASSINQAADSCEGSVDALFCCAGVADGTPGIDRVNFIGQRHLINRLRARSRFKPEAAIAMVSSTAALGWEQHLDELTGFLDAEDFDAANKWIEENPQEKAYRWSKMAVCAYVARESYNLLKEGIRINSTSPGPTDTPLARTNTPWLTFGHDYRESLQLSASTPEEQALPLIFLCSSAARHISGINLVVDIGYASAGAAGAFDAPGIRERLGRS